MNSFRIQINQQFINDVRFQENQEKIRKRPSMRKREQIYPIFSRPDRFGEKIENFYPGENTNRRPSQSFFFPSGPHRALACQEKKRNMHPDGTEKLSVAFLSFFNAWNQICEIHQVSKALNTMLTKPGGRFS